MSRISGQAFVQSYVELHKVRQIQFSLLKPQEVIQISVAKIDQEQIYKDNGQPIMYGINDPRMGTMDQEMRCLTCRGNQTDCPGHFGHIELSRPVYHAGLLEYIIKILRSVCFRCSKILGVRDQARREALSRIKRDQTRFERVFKESDHIKQCDPTNGCGHTQPKFSKQGLGILCQHQENEMENGRDNQESLTPERALEVLKNISDEDCVLLGLNPNQTRPEYMIITNLAVAPPPVRPSVAMGSMSRSEDDLTYCYKKIVQYNNILRTQIERGANNTTINDYRRQLQYFVATLMDNNISGQPVQKHKSGKQLKAIRERLKGKEGRLRGNLMGKRVDFSARTVITPDPILRLDQLGVPRTIAMNLTVPETVTQENLGKMRMLIENGPSKWPGAKYIIRLDDRQIDLSQGQNRSDQHIEPGYKVERHLMDDDYVIFNRQPSLHKMSLMGHRVKVLPYSTFRLNLSVTTPYNADFDGDEMNMHVPQSYETMAEIKEIMAVPKQIVTPQKNSPVMGIVQDSLLGIMLFTLKDCFFTMDVLMNLLMWIEWDHKIPHPCILKPKPLWSGKQVLNLIIPEINYEKISEKGKNGIVWNSYKDKNVFIKQGELLCGVMTKGTVGSSSGGLIHLIWKEHGPEACKDFLSNAQLIVNNWLYNNGFTVGVQDIIAKKEIIDEIRETLQIYKFKTKQILYEAQMGKLKSQPGKSMLETFESQVNQNLNKSRDQAGNIALEDLSSQNRLKAMVFAGSKGSNLNISQIMACVGQQNVEGKRIPFGFKKRSLPHFSKDDFGPESKGFVENCYLDGLTPSEFYFHAMAGREGLIDTAVKTAETGYIQRRLIKALEDVMAKYDGTVRTSKEQVIQFLYGEDGLAGENIEDMDIDLFKLDDQQVKKQHEFLPEEMKSIEIEELLGNCLDPAITNRILQSPEQVLLLRNEFKQIIEDRDNLRNFILGKQFDDKIHIGVNVQRLLWNAQVKFGIKQTQRTELDPIQVLEQMRSFENRLRVIPGCQIGDNLLLKNANENCTLLFKIFLRQILSTKQVIQHHRLNKESFDWLLGEIESRFYQAIVNPGEMVGSIGAQSIGEPATQMTLNTFHNTGISSKNVTLGVPRLKEVINVAKNIKTPSMRIYVEDEFYMDNDEVTRIGGSIEHTTLNDIVQNSQIYYDPDPLKTVVQADRELIDLYNEIPQQNQSQSLTNWILRFEFDHQKITFKNLKMQDINDRLVSYFQEQMNIIYSDDNAENLVLRIRIDDVQDDEESTVCMYLKELEDQLLNGVTLNGINEISKVTFSAYTDIKIDNQTGKLKPVSLEVNGKELQPIMIETDGVALQRVLGVPKVNPRKTTSNDIIEILRVLGIEAVRRSLINELRQILGTYGIYVNYRHVSILCDIMTQRGILTSITRHGINRGDNGPLRKCSFEETVEILLQAAFFSEIDPLTGITENIILGQLAPYGTGSFDLVIDTNVIDENAQNNDNLNIFEDQTPRMDFNGGYDPLNDQIQTPIVGNTPGYQSIYQGGATQYDVMGNYGAFSPGQNMQSPNQQYGMTSQYQMGSPQYQSPLYNLNNEGGIYGNTMGGSNQSPQIYSPTGYQSPQMTSGNAYGYSNQSPYMTSAMNQNTRQYQSPYLNQATPQYYSPTAQNYYSPNYTPGSPIYNQTQGRHQNPNQSPRYNINQQVQQNLTSSMSPAYQGEQIQRTLGGDQNTTQGQNIKKEQNE